MVFFCRSKGQGTVEYLVIMGVIIVIGLVVVAMLSGYFDSSGNTSVTVSGIGGKISAPISVLDAVIDPSGNGVVRLQNNSGSALTITGVDVGGKAVNYSSSSISSGIQVFSLLGLQSSSCVCPVSFTGVKKCSVTVRATSVNGLPLSWTLTDIVVQCSSDATVPSGVPKADPIISLSTPYVWVANSGDDTVSKVDYSTGVVVGTYGVGDGPLGVAVDGSGNVWVTNYGDDTVSKLNGVTGALLGTYSVGNGPMGVAVDASRNIWVANFEDDSVSKLNGSTGATIGTYSVGDGAQAVAVDSNNNVWVANYFDSTVSKLSGSTGVVAGTYSVGSGPISVAVDSNVNIWVANHDAATVSKLSGVSGGTIGTYNVGVSGIAPQGIAVTADGNVWVADVSDNNVSKLNGVTGDLIGSYSVVSPYGVAVSSDGNVWVADNSENAVYRLHGSTGAATGPYVVGTGPISYGDMTGFALQYFVLGRR